MELAIVLVIVGLAALYAGRSFVRRFRPGASSGAACGCSGCGIQGSCAPGQSAKTPADCCPQRPED